MTNAGPPVIRDRRGEDASEDEENDPRYAVEHGDEYSSHQLSPVPTIHPTARISGSHLGEWTEVCRDVRMCDSELGRYSYAMERCQFDYATVGKFTNVASDVRLGPTTHPTERPTQHHMTYRRQMYEFADEDGNEVFERRREQSVRVGHDVWLGHGSTVLPDLAVGTGAVVGAGAVVTRDVEPYSVVAGVPAEPIGRRFSESVADRFQEIAWWDWPRDVLERRFRDFRDLDTFLERYGCES